MLASLLPILGTIFQSVAASIFPNPEDKLKAQELQNQLQLAVLQAASQIEQAGAANVKSEIEGGSWLQRNWRPIMMLFFMGLVGARWFGYSAPNMAPSEYDMLWQIIQIGLGGYTIGRTVEKIAPQVASVLKKSP